MIAGVWRRMTFLDRLIVVVLLAAVAASFALLDQRPAGARVQVERDGQLLFSAPLSDSRQVNLAGPLGDTLLEIAAGQARILDSPCPHKVCVGMGRISRRGALIACVPNRMIVHIEGDGEEETPIYDLLSH